jgi:hypothetical protein
MVTNSSASPPSLSRTAAPAGARRPGSNQRQAVAIEEASVIETSSRPVPGGPRTAFFSGDTPGASRPVPFILALKYQAG